MPTMTQLRAFVAIAELKHFGEAATRLSVSQSSLSQSLAALEATLELQLIERTTRQVLVTPAGEALLPKARAAVDAMESFVEAASTDHRWLAGPLRIGMIPTIAPYILPALLRELHEQAPDLEPTFKEDQTERLRHQLRAGHLDVIFIALPLVDTSLTTIPVYEEDFVLALPADHLWAGRSDLNPAELSQVELLLLDEGHCLRDQALDLCASAGATGVVQDGTRAASLSTVMQLVAGGLGATLLPGTAIRPETQGRNIATAAFTSPAPGRQIALAMRASNVRMDEFADLAQITRQAVERAHLAASPLLVPELTA